MLTDRNGKHYLSLTLSDSSGSLNGRLWDKAEDLGRNIQSGDFVEIKGHAQLYQNRLQVVIHDLKKTQLGDNDLRDFVPKSKADSKELMAQLFDLVAEIKDPHIRQLLDASLNDPEIKELLMMAPAAKTIHHAYMGGLLEHIVSICGVMKGLAAHYTFLNLDYLIFGAIFHDLGKTQELKVEDGIKYTDVGRLVGHMGIATNIIESKSQKILGFPEDLKNLLKHIVYSHHGRLEYGSLKTPVFPEAFVVAMVDDLDSKLNTMVEFMKEEIPNGERWTRYHQGFDRYFYLDVLRDKLSQS